MQRTSNDKEHEKVEERKLETCDSDFNGRLKEEIHTWMQKRTMCQLTLTLIKKKG